MMLETHSYQAGLWVGERLDDLWTGRLSTVNAELEKVDVSQAMNSDDIETSIGYFERQQNRMKYHQYRIAGYPTGSGAVESGINPVILAPRFVAILVNFKSLVKVCRFSYS